MKNIFILCSLLVLCTTSHAQWTWLNPKPQGNTLNDIFILPSGERWAVGQNGAIVYSLNWTSWILKHSELERTPFSGVKVAFISSDSGIILTSNGKIMRTTNKGADWGPLLTPTISIRSFTVAPDQSLWACGSAGTIARSTDLGLTWTTINTGITESIYELSFIDQSNLIAVGSSGTILKSTDSGTTWIKQTHKAADIISVSFGSSSNGVALQIPRTIMRTTDGGVTWQDTTVSINSGRQIKMRSDKNVLLVSNSPGVIHSSTDVGVSWKTDSVEMSFKATFNSVAVHPQNWQTIVGDGSACFRNRSQPLWIPEISLTYEKYSAVSALNANELVVFGNYTDRSTDGGTTWDIISYDKDMYTGLMLTSTRYIAAGLGRVFLTTNAGNTWSQIDLSLSTTFTKMIFSDSQNGWLVGTNGTIARSFDAGSTWNLKSSGTTKSLQSIAAVSNTEAWTVGALGTILHTTNGGTSWQQQNANTTNDLYCVEFPTSKIGWAGGYQTLIKTIDGGATWQNAPYLVGLENINEIKFSDTLHGWFVKSTGIFKTSDGGATFYREDYPTSELEDIAVFSSGKTFAVGKFGAILKYSPAPYLTFSPSPLQFGDVETTKNKILELTLNNSGEVDLKIDTITISGNRMTLLDQTSNVVITPGSSKIVRVQFSPTSLGNVEGAIQIKSSDEIQVRTMRINGNGIEPILPQLETTPSAVQFGILAVGNYAVKKITMTNTGTTALLINSEEITGKDSLDFYILKQSALFLNANASDSILIVFRPLSSGNKIAFLTISSTDPVAPIINVGLSGNATAPHIVLSASSLDFGSVLLNSTNEMILKISNTGSAELTISRSEIIGADKSLFAIKKQLPTKLSAGSSDSMAISFTPISIGTVQAQLEIDCNDPQNQNVVVSVNGKGVKSLDVRHNDTPSEFILYQNYPNPFGTHTASNSSMTIIEFEVEDYSRVQIDVQNIFGAIVQTLTSSNYDRGKYRMQFNANNFVSGIYIAQMNVVNSKNQSASRKIIMMYLK